MSDALMALGSGGSNTARSAWPEMGDPTERQSNRPTCDPKGGWPCVRSSPAEDIEALPIRATRDLKALLSEVAAHLKGRTGRHEGTSVTQ